MTHYLAKRPSYFKRSSSLLVQIKNLKQKSVRIQKKLEGVEAENAALKLKLRVQEGMEAEIADLKLKLRVQEGVSEQSGISDMPLLMPNLEGTIFTQTISNTMWGGEFCTDYNIM